MLKLSNFIHNSVALNFIFLFLTEVPNFINSTLQPQERITAQGIDNYFHQELIYKRNERMGKRVKAVLEELSDKGFFLAFGAGHFMGNNTVLDVLLREGYESRSLLLMSWHPDSAFSQHRYTSCIRRPSVLAAASPPLLMLLPLSEAPSPPPPMGKILPFLWSALLAAQVSTHPSLLFPSSSGGRAQPLVALCLF
ncbi:metalloprotease TIKI1 isoform X1 [Pteropus vampyrus]|uniref:Metalloprotease TIKI n=1 Tax=Pteropus vampyrus TaxID=132908 RepID=A0A6P3R4T9_PTEVA|nr:metalloprotease TIKI1 isoform X1 [Pteropus vampyrus]